MVLSEHFGADITEGSFDSEYLYPSELQGPELEAAYLEGLKFLVRWDLGDADPEWAQRYLGENATARVYNAVSHQIWRSVESESVATTQLVRHTLYVGGTNVVHSTENIPVDLIYDVAGEEEARDLAGYAYENCEDKIQCTIWYFWNTHNPTD